MKLVTTDGGYLAVPLAEPDEFGRTANTLIVSCPAGGYDLIKADDFDNADLRRALYDERETGGLPSDCDCVELPCGTLFCF